MIGPVPSPRPTALVPSVSPAGTRRAVHSATPTAPATVTVRRSPAPTWIRAPGTHGLSEPPLFHVNEPSVPVTGSPPSAARLAGGGSADMDVAGVAAGAAGDAGDAATVATGDGGDVGDAATVAAGDGASDGTGDRVGVAIDPDGEPLARTGDGGPPAELHAAASSTMKRVTSAVPADRMAMEKAPFIGSVPRHGGFRSGTTGDTGCSCTGRHRP